MFRSYLRPASAIALTAILAGCNTGNPGQLLNPNPQPAVDQVTQSPVVQGACPKVSLREGTAYFTKYASKAEETAENVVHQATITNTNRQCRTDGANITMTVQASGRVVAGPKGGAGEVALPVRVVVVEGENVVYSELQQQKVALPQGQPTAQFLFTDATVTLPATSSRTARVWVGFDAGPYDTP